MPLLISTVMDLGILGHHSRNWLP